MAKPDLFLAPDATRGRDSEYIYPRRGNRMYFYPRLKPVETSPALTAVRDRFSDAAEYAKAVLLDPDRRAFYEPLALQRRRNVRTVIMTDYLRPPVVGPIDLERFTGATGEPLKVRAKDDCDVLSVTFAIHRADGTPLEQGAATKQGNHWVYVTTVAHPADTPEIGRAHV